MATHLLSRLSVHLIIAISACVHSANGRFGCLGCLCTGLCPKQNTVHAFDANITLFDNCLLTGCVDDIPPLSPKSYMILEMGSSRSEFVEPDPSDADIKWFDINSDLITQNKTSKSNSYHILLLMGAYDITHFIFFIGHYLPLQHLPNRKQLRRVFEFFSQFQHGVDHVDLKSFIHNYNSTRKRFMDLGNQWEYMRELESNKHVLGFDDNETIIFGRQSHTPASKMRKDHATKTSTHFWETNWLLCLQSNITRHRTRTPRIINSTRNSQLTLLSQILNSTNHYLVNMLRCAVFHGE
eukprot:750935_1